MMKIMIGDDNDCDGKRNDVEGEIDNNDDEDDFDENCDDEARISRSWLMSYSTKFSNPTRLPLMKKFADYHGQFDILQGFPRNRTRDTGHDKQSYRA